MDGQAPVSLRRMRLSIGVRLALSYPDYPLPAEDLAHA